MGEIRLKIMQQKCIYVRGSKLKSSDVPRRLPFGCLFKMFWGRPQDGSPKLCKYTATNFSAFLPLRFGEVRSKKRTTVMCYVIYFKIGVLSTSRGQPFRTPLGRPWDVSVQFMSKWINLIVFASWWYVESTSIRKVLRKP